MGGQQFGEIKEGTKERYGPSPAKREEVCSPSTLDSLCAYALVSALVGKKDCRIKDRQEPSAGTCQKVAVTHQR